MSLLLTREGGPVRTLTLNRPEKANALNQALLMPCTPHSRASRQARSG